MAYIGAADQEKLRARFERDLENDVRLVLFAQPPSGLYIPGREEPQTGRETRQLMEELAALSPKLRLEVHHPGREPELAAQYGVERSPALVLLPALSPSDDTETRGHGDTETRGHGDTGTRRHGDAENERPASGEGDSGVGLVRFFGLPSGYEFMTLIEDIVDLSRRRTRLSEAARQAATTLPGPVHLQVFVTPT